MISNVRKDYSHFRSNIYLFYKIKGDDRERSRSKSKEKNGHRYITSNTRATVPARVEGDELM